MNFDAKTEQLRQVGVSREAELRDEVAPKLDFIFGPPSLRNTMKRNVIAQDLEPRLKPRTAPVTRSDLEQMPIPDIPPQVEYNLTQRDILETTWRQTEGTREDMQRVLRYAMVWSGVRVADDASARWMRLDPGHEEGTRYPRVTVPVDKKRLSLRAVPQEAWGDASSHLWTPFALREYRGRKVLTMEEGDREGIVAIPDGYFVGDSVQTPAYITKRGNNEYAISTNSLQRCSHRCGYCCRGYHTMTEGRFNELINLTAPELARYLVTKFDIDDWAKIKEVAFITGVFPNDDVLLRYLEDFGGKMKDLTKGKFNPMSDLSQTLKVSSHLLRDEETMRKAKALGVRSFTFTVEMADDTRRAEVMPLATGKMGKNVFMNRLNTEKWGEIATSEIEKREKNKPLDRLNTVVKGKDRFEQVLDILGTAIDVFGADNVEPVMVMGLDPLDVAIGAMDRLKDIGIRKLNRGLNNVYDSGQHGLIRVPFRDAVAQMQYARNNFNTGYRQIVDRVDRNVANNTSFAA